MQPAAPIPPPLVEGPFDLLVVGGGINGTAIARDAVLRGKSVVLLEKDDFGQGTSSRSSKMAHGGIRYLEHFQFGLVYEALRERHYLLKLAPHLVRSQAFVLPIYEGSRRGPFLIRLGLFLYDKLALGRRPGKCRFLSRDETLQRVPTLRSDGLRGAGLYYDAVMDDARLVLANAMAAVEAGATRPGAVIVRSHCEVTSIEPGSPCAAMVRDKLSGRVSRVLAHHVVRALGPWTERDRLVPSKGVHLVLPAFPMPDGLLLSHAKDGRVFFLIPWLGRTVIGTTETAFEESPDNLRVEPEEVAYLFNEVQRLFPDLKIRPQDILGTFAGVRPLARGTGWFSSKSPGSVSRSHRIDDEKNGVVSVYGGKYTTYRAVAQDVLDRLYPGTSCATRRQPLPGGEHGSWKTFEATRHPAIAQLGSSEAERLFERYGSRLIEIARLLEQDPALAARLTPDQSETRAEAIHSITREFVAYPEDFLVRRTNLRWTQDGGRSAYDAVEELIRRHAVSVPQDLAAARARYHATLESERQLRESMAASRP